MRKTFLIIVLLLTIGCRDIDRKLFGINVDNDFLTIKSTTYMGNQLRIDGYYYETWKENDGKKNFSSLMFLYRNGVVFNIGGLGGSLKEADDYANQNLFNNDVKNKKSFWGAFIIKKNKIIYESHVGSERGYRVYREEGNIINDTTFVMTNLYRMNKGVKTDEKSVHTTYYFRKFSPKPDSTNSFFP